MNLLIFATNKIKIKNEIVSHDAKLKHFFASTMTEDFESMEQINEIGYDRARKGELKQFYQLLTKKLLVEILISSRYGNENRFA